MPLYIYFHSPFHSVFSLHFIQFPSYSIFHSISYSDPYSTLHYTHFPLQAVSIPSHTAFKSIFYSILFNTPNTSPFYFVLCFQLSIHYIQFPSHFAKIVITMTFRRSACQYLMKELQMCLAYTKSFHFLEFIHNRDKLKI